MRKAVLVVTSGLLVLGGFFAVSSPASAAAPATTATARTEIQTLGVSATQRIGVSVSTYFSDADGDTLVYGISVIPMTSTCDLFAAQTGGARIAAAATTRAAAVTQGLSGSTIWAQGKAVGNCDFAVQAWDATLSATGLFRMQVLTAASALTAGDGSAQAIAGDEITESLAVAKDAVLENMAGVVLAAATGIAIVLALVFIAVYWGRFKSFLIGLIRR